MTLQQRLDQLRSLDSHNLGSWPLWVRIGATVLAAVFILGMGSWLYVRPKVHTLHEHQAREAHLKKEFKRKEEKVANLGAYEAQLHRMKHSFSGLLRQLPSKTEEAKLLNDISHARVASGLKEKLFKPKKEIPKDFYAVLPIQIVVVGTYHEMGDFASRVASLPRVVTLHDVAIQPVNKKDAPSDELRMHAVAKTYRYIGDDASNHSSDGGKK